MSTEQIKQKVEEIVRKKTNDNELINDCIKAFDKLLDVRKDEALVMELLGDFDRKCPYI